MYEFLGISAGLILLSLAAELGGPNPVVKTDFAKKPLIVVAVR